MPEYQEQRHNFGTPDLLVLPSGQFRLEYLLALSRERTHLTKPAPQGQQV
jgi:hypothetical protein